MGTQGHEAEQELRGTHIGYGVHIRFFAIGENKRAGIFVAHRHSDGCICSGAVPFDVPENTDGSRPKWKVKCLDPLTLSPSIEDKSCGLHGHIQEGKWQPQ